MPMDSEKNDWPIAARNLLELSLAKSGRKRNWMPFSAPGSMHEPATTTSSRIKSRGIIILEARSMPLRTPWIMTKWVMARMAMVQSTGCKGDEEKFLKYSVM